MNYFCLFSTELCDFIYGGRPIEGFDKAQALAKELAREMCTSPRTIEIRPYTPSF